jgi:hypothetical protein
MLRLPIAMTGVARRIYLNGAGVGFLCFALVQDACSGTTSTSGHTCTLTPPTQDAFCKALAHYDEGCGHCQDCTAQNLQNCAKAESAASVAYQSAFIACQDGASCNGDPHYSKCVEQKMASAVPTAAQDQARVAYCTACSGTNTADCTNFFSVDPASGKNGAGYNILLYGDAIASQAAMMCSRTCDLFRYSICVALLACGPSGGDFCADGGFCAPQ